MDIKVLKENIENGKVDDSILIFLISVFTYLHSYIFFERARKLTPTLLIYITGSQVHHYIAYLCLYYSKKIGFIV